MELLICILIDHFVCAEVFTRELGSLYLATRFIKYVSIVLRSMS